MLMITKKFNFEAAHHISNHPGLCREIHGHSYTLAVTLKGPIDPATDMIMDFKIIKKMVNAQIIKEQDHALLLKKNEENAYGFSFYQGKVLWLSSEPTAERLWLWLVSKIRKCLPENIQLIRINLQDTPDSLATWESHENKI
ncbi:MAG: 6-carboxytetrahydropterin synthase [Cyclobacteriaceae bacterium]